MSWLEKSLEERNTQLQASSTAAEMVWQVLYHFCLIFRQKNFGL